MPDITFEQLIDQLDEKLDIKLDAQAEVSKAHWDAFRRECNAGFAGINARLDKVNGRLDKHGDRIAVIERHPRLQPRATDEPRKVADEDKPFLTRREWKLVSGVAGGTLLALQLLWPVLKAVWP